jgi:hypothetical protein
MIKCDVIQDLLPLYNDNVASDSSRAMVDEHIKSCSVCREVLAKMQEGNNTIHLSVDTAEVKAFRKIKRKIFRRNALIACLSIIITAAFIYGAFGYQTPVSYNPNKISVNLAINETIEIFYNGNYISATARHITDEVYVTFHGTLFTRLFYDGEKKLFSIESSFIFDSGGKGEGVVDLENAIGEEIRINRVYYLDSRKAYSSGAEFEQAKKDAVLIWERTN